jgi:hypothetical protein
MVEKWKTYEEVATYLLNEFAKEFGLERVEGKQPLIGQRSGTRWTIDAKGTKEGGEGFIIVECRHYTTSKPSQESVAALGYRIMDTEAEGGIIVSPFGVQEGAAKVAAAANIQVVRLDENSTTTQYMLSFLNKVMIGLEEHVHISDSVKVILIKNSERH